ncbi:hypothetical protein WN51_08933 [Melipona quadrifasciata]|uniref:Uncharacterized protein n=1 Tax=Melipona quadrifasciata TaxID=166423 RepID=A0A0M8ZMY0_9HYME|nr:hypothetical protein WN51_08933 [Melipona quadrifasciata]
MNKVLHTARSKQLLSARQKGTKLSGVVYRQPGNLVACIILMLEYLIAILLLSLPDAADNSRVVVWWWCGGGGGGGGGGSGSGGGGGVGGVGFASVVVGKIGNLRPPELIDGAINFFRTDIAEKLR